MLHILLPIALVPRPIHVSVDTVAVRLVVLPLALKHVPIDVPEFSTPARLIEPPEAFVAGTIWPYLHTEAMLHIA